MNWTLLAIPLVLLTALTILVWFLTGVKALLVSKLGVCLALVWIFFASWGAFPSYMGYPTTQKLPDTFQVRWIVVDEPKRIFLWVQELGLPKDPELLEYRPGPRLVRSHEIAYSKEAHKICQQALEALAQGKPVIVQKSQKSNGSRTAERARGKDRSLSNDLEGFEFMEGLPPSMFPEK